jgi:hypothetical protein
LLFHCNVLDNGRINNYLYDDVLLPPSVADCLDGLGQSGEAVVEQLTNGVDGTSREIILRLSTLRKKNRQALLHPKHWAIPDGNNLSILLIS